MIKDLKLMWTNYEKLKKDESGQASQQFVLLCFVLLFYILGDLFPLI